MSAKPRYRADIQGLRGVAVALVVLFHAAPSWVSGGFIGVDVFFVISGFLITRVLKKDWDEMGKVRLGRFWVRRVLRLLPASLLVVAATTTSYRYLPTSLWEPLSHMVLAASLFGANAQLLANSSDYFLEGTLSSPLSHYWSLAVEEQFYVAWPVILLLMLRWHRLTITKGIVFLLCGSFLLSLWQSFAAPQIAYLAPWTRAWELLLGCGLAALPWRRLPALKLHSARLQGAGLALIVASAFLLDASLPFPGFAALAPCLGAALILAFPLEPTRSVLSLRVVTWLGDISYPLYLWHFPTLLFARVVWGHQPLSVLGALGVALVLGWCTHRCVERPMRNLASKMDRERRPVWFAIGLLVSTIFLGFAGKEAIQSGQRSLASQPSRRGKMQKARTDRPSVYGKPCFLNFNGEIVATCVVGHPAASERIALVGDSHAIQWLPALEDWATASFRQIEVHAKVRCPFANTPSALHTGEAYGACDRWKRRVMKELLTRPPNFVLISQARHVFSLSKQTSDMIEGIHQIVRELERAGIPAILIEDSPRAPYNVPDCLERMEARMCDFPLSEGLRPADALRLAAQKYQLPIVSLNDEICPDGWCSVMQQDRAIFRDQDHLTATFVKSMTMTLLTKLDSSRIHAESRVDDADDLH